MPKPKVETIFSSPPLENFLLKKTANVEEVHNCVSRVLTPHRVKTREPLAGHSDREAILHHAPLANSSFNYLFYGVETRVDASQLGFYLIEIPLSGKSTTRYGEGSIESAPGSAVIAGPYNEFTSEWDRECTKLLIKIETQLLENYLSTLLGRKQTRVIEFEMEMDLYSDSGQSLLRSITWIVNELEHNHSLLNKQQDAGAHYERILMWNLLHAQVHNYSEELANRPRPSIPDFLLKAKSHIEENYSSPLSLDEIVRVSGVSQRSILGGFRQHWGVSPMKYLKFVRLEHAHLILKESSPDNGNVTEIAVSVGFTQLGGFSMDYKDRFGSSPSSTLNSISPIPSTK